MKIKKLSDEELALIPQVCDEWTKISLDTNPVDSAKVQEILERLYALANKPPPKHVLHLDSPLQISYAISLLRLGEEPLRNLVTDSITGQVREQIHGQFASRTYKQLGNHVFQQVDDYVRELNRNGRARIDFTVAAMACFSATSEAIGAEVNDSDIQEGIILDNVLNCIITTELIREQDLDQILDQIRLASRESSGRYIEWPKRDDFGQTQNSLAWFDFVGRLGVDVSKLAPSFDLAKKCGMAILFWDLALISAKPEYIKCDEQNQLHCETGAAVRYPDGFSVFALHGVHVKEKVVVAPQTITMADIESVGYDVARWLMIERYGLKRFLEDSGAEELHRDNFGILYRKNIPHDSEPLVMVKMVDFKPAPGGIPKEYIIRVPPTMVQAREAVTWAFSGKI